jgi:hypothetical protein
MRFFPYKKNKRLSMETKRIREDERKKMTNRSRYIKIPYKLRLKLFTIKNITVLIGNFLSNSLSVAVFLVAVETR